MCWLLQGGTTVDIQGRFKNRKALIFYAGLYVSCQATYSIGLHFTVVSDAQLGTPEEKEQVEQKAKKLRENQVKQPQPEARFQAGEPQLQ